MITFSSVGSIRNPISKLVSIEYCGAFIAALMNVFLTYDCMSQDTIQFRNEDYVVNDTAVFKLIDTSMIQVADSTISLQFASILSTKYIDSLEQYAGLQYLRHNRLKWYGFIHTGLAELGDVLDQEFISSNLINTCVPSIYKAFLIPDDDDYYLQWYLVNDDNCDIEIEGAWDITTGSYNVTIAVIDLGVDWEHVELGVGNDAYQNIFLNTGDTWSDPNDPYSGDGIDNDNNGFIDDYKGWDFINGAPLGNNDARPNQIQEHGTKISGIIAAKTDNDNLVAGIAGGFSTEGIKILPIQIGNVTWYYEGSVIDDAILYAVDMGVDIISMSMGSKVADLPIVQALDAAHSAGVFLVCASGNIDKPTDTDITFPASHENVFSVGASNDIDKWCNFSRYSGAILDIVAPGEGIYNITYSANSHNNASYGSGTSYASPIVSGIAGLMLSVNPCLSNTMMVEILRHTADKVNTYWYNYNGNPNYPGHNEKMGYGRVNAEQSVSHSGYMYVEGVDLYMEDLPHDFGIEPPLQNGIQTWISEDIWIRNQDDGMTNHEHQNPIYDPNNPV